MRRFGDFLLAGVWMVMGLGCKVLGLVPRHEEIVARLLGSEHARLLTVGIGWGEVGIALWILTGIRRRLAAAVQILLVAVMNLIELRFASDLLLFGWGNLGVATCFCGFVAWNAWSPTRAREC